MLKYLRNGASLREGVAELKALPAGQVVTIGLATVVLAPVVLPLVRPAIKATIKTGVMAFDKTKQTIAETGEIIADIAAEAKAEARAETLQVRAEAVAPAEPTAPSEG
ncbi:MAG: DUF5132 domain-containing protein [Geitlerinemataceae cyanobacterium]